jgi:hypothetical protein
MGDHCYPTEAALVLIDYALALCALLGTLLIPFCAMYQVLRLRRRAIRVTATRSDRS